MKVDSANVPRRFGAAVHNEKDVQGAAAAVGGAGPGRAGLSPGCPRLLAFMTS